MFLSSPHAPDTGFPCVARPDARVLILGSMPSVASLGAMQYYAHPRNAFWPIMGELFHFDASLAYDKKLEKLRECGIALWDVVHRCHRPGSLDSSIETDSVETNDFRGFFARYPKMEAVFFNGGTAERLFRRMVLVTLPEPLSELPMNRLPSTSPAHAARSFHQKLESWWAIRRVLDASGAASTDTPPDP
ncbi:MAG TPA: DNA-deoxyinosine glycosylase [Mariprofundaceae bacterium]|nr:DNA-deoxyinosine glycosylase [Mariprofundaceae bacterium]